MMDWLMQPAPPGPWIYIWIALLSCLGGFLFTVALNWQLYLWSIRQWRKDRFDRKQHVS